MSFHPHRSELRDRMANNDAMKKSGLHPDVRTSVSPGLYLGVFRLLVVVLFCELLLWVIQADRS